MLQDRRKLKMICNGCVCICDEIHIVSFQNAGRLYEVDGVLVKLEHGVLAKFREWNTQLLCNDTFYDRRMVELLLMCGLGSDRIANGDISRKFLKFITGSAYLPFFQLIENQSSVFL